LRVYRPVAFGEKVVIRIFDPTILLQDITALGLTAEQRVVYERLLKRPHGIILVTGPTGSGKTTTLYSSLQSITSPEVNVITIEDPIEMVRSVQPDRGAGVGQPFATRCAASCAKTPTSSWWERFATPTPHSTRCRRR
jgi:energy-coupling factor transporter ATP-binding protein EcfA2